MERQPDIHKAAGILLRDRKLLVERSRGKQFFISPGGSLEPGETTEQALIRELVEEFGIVVQPGNLEPFGTFYAQAAGAEDKRVRMDVFMVKEWEGDPTPSGEVEEIAWITSTPPSGMKVGSIFEHEVIPRLKTRGLLD